MAKRISLFGGNMWKCLGVKDHDICNLASDDSENKGG